MVHCEKDILDLEVILKVTFISLVPKKTATKSIDDLKIVENVVHKADEMKCMSQYLLDGEENKKNPL